MSSPAGPFDLWPTGPWALNISTAFSGATPINGIRPCSKTHAPIEPSCRITRTTSLTATWPIRRFSWIAPTACPCARPSRGSSTTPPAPPMRRTMPPRSGSPKYKGQFDQGWDKVREETLARQNQAWHRSAERATDRAPDRALPAWDSLVADQKRAVCAHDGSLCRGTFLRGQCRLGVCWTHCRTFGQLDNTLIIFLMGDNGASPEGTLQGTTNEVRPRQWRDRRASLICFR